MTERYYVDNKLRVLDQDGVERLARKLYRDDCAWEVNSRGRVVSRSSQVETITRPLRVIEWVNA